MKKILIFLIAGLAHTGYALNNNVPLQPVITQSKQTGVLIAKGEKDRKSKQRYLQGEARSSSSKTSIDFDAAAIDGERRTPVGVQVGGSKQDHGYDLINLRLRWHPEMIKSTSNLETGKGD